MDVTYNQNYSLIVERDPGKAVEIICTTNRGFLLHNILLIIQNNS